MLYHFNVKEDKLDDFERLCNRYRYSPDCYFDDGYYLVDIDDDSRLEQFIKQCNDNNILWRNNKI